MAHLNVADLAERVHTIATAPGRRARLGATPPVFIAPVSTRQPSQSLRSLLGAQLSYSAQPINKFLAIHPTPPESPSAE
jgi:hypothetical protein